MVHPDLQGLRVVDLKELCKTHGLDQKGKKADLQERLTEFLNAQEAAAAPEQAPSEVTSSQEVAREQEEEVPVAEEPTASLPDFKTEKPSSQELPAEPEAERETAAVEEPVAEPEQAAASLPVFKSKKPSSQEPPAEDEPEKEQEPEKGQEAPPSSTPVFDIKPDISQLQADKQPAQEECPKKM
ncbi:Oidioi.mRNA.OKI2018_I69.PAR.g10078.t1.cds [Oikopleura dioica]|uniref:Oidioi.mRNA.OKI2018_I69.PAR.g10078.t1.cds n=1 Tax=Oikopleura dioica TaxID=34765 RepID=A0ABN7RRT3_OIKDI|nr:Oidioi.mRNA.OKI2018_I69.PAR.g10078.t1.cds [Oikopleura dioica]